jgi:DNA-binding MarR family transcriptional regulator
MARVTTDAAATQPTAKAKQSSATQSEAQPDAAAVVEEASLALVEMTFSAVASARGLSTLQLRMLLVVDRHAPLNLSALADRLDLSVPSASRLAERLVESGLVQRGPARHSRREVTLGLTAKGRRALARLRSSRQKAIAEVLDRMPSAEVAGLVSGLTAFAAAAER